MGLNSGCIDPVSPDFEFREGLLFVEGFASTVEGASFVTINESALEFNVEVVNFISGADVYLTEESSGRRVYLGEQQDAYVPPPGFAVSPGESWRLEIALEDGRVYNSTFEKVTRPVPVESIRARYSPRMMFREASGRYIPGHEILINFTDPQDEDNYYYWSYRTYENLTNCEHCISAIFRGGECVDAPVGTFLMDYYDYKCETDCWEIRYPEHINIFDDRLSNGKPIKDLLTANIPLYSKENMVVELQQHSLTPKGYEYYRVIKDLVDNNSGLNAPPPAALIGNLSNPNDPEDVVFGRFTATASTAAYIFIDRSGIEENAINLMQPIKREGCEVCPPNQACPIACAPVNTAACSETRYRTALAPQGWINQ